MDTIGIKDLVRKVEGWLTDGEAELLYELARNCTGRGVIVEIGSWKGKSTICLGKGSKAGHTVKVFAVDPHTAAGEAEELVGKTWTFREFRRNIKNAKVDDIIFPIVKTSEAAAKNFGEPVELIFVDGTHEYESVKLDFELWSPKVVNGGIISFHDTIAWSGPRKAVEELMYKSSNFRNIRFLDSITFGERVKQASLRDILGNRYGLLSKKAYQYILKLRIKKPIPKTIRVAGRRLFRLFK